MSRGPDSIEEAFALYFMCPLLLLGFVIYTISSMVSCHKESQITPEQRAIIQQQNSLSYKTGKAARAAGSNFVKGFFSN